MTSWVIVNTETGEPLVETWNREKAEWVNKYAKTYKAVPIIEWLSGLNRRAV